MFSADPRALASTAAAAAACGLAAARGRKAERWGAGMTFAAWMLSPLVQLYPLGRMQWGVATVDAALTVGLFTLALAGDRWWPLPACSIMLLVLSDHLAFRFVSGIWPWPYFLVEDVCGYLLLAVLVVGAHVEGAAGKPARNGLVRS